MKFGVLGSGSWGTALAKILTDNNQHINWYNRSEQAAEIIRKRGNNPQYLSQVKFKTELLNVTTNANELFSESDIIVVAVPSAYVTEVLTTVNMDVVCGKKILSAVKGILPDANLLLNDYLKQQCNFALSDYFAVMGPCHAEEVAAEKLSYLTFGGIDEVMAAEIASRFSTPYLNTIVNRDIYGVQYAAVLKNIYAVGAGIAHGLDYGDNFLSVLIANSADEMAAFLRKAGVMNAEVGNIDHHSHLPGNNYAASVYLGDLLVTCYSLHSRNRSFGNLIGRGYSVKSAQMEMSMVAEGYYACKTMYHINEQVKCEMPIANGIYRILWMGENAKEVFEQIEKELI